MTGSYDEADRLIDFAKEQSSFGVASYWSKDVCGQLAALDEAVTQNEKWHNKRYWPRNPEAQAQLSAIYERKGIESGQGGGCSGGRTARWPKKVKESEFKDVVHIDVLADAFCVMWLRDVPGVRKAVCEIVAVKIEDGEVAGEIRSYVRPWGVKRDDKRLASSILGISYEELDASPDIFEILPKVFELANATPIVIKDSDQESLLIRATRYCGLGAVPCAVFVASEHDSANAPLEILEDISDVQVSECNYKFDRTTEHLKPDFTDFVSFDTETTGLSRFDRIVEIGAVRVLNGVVVDRFQTLCNPERSIPEAASSVNGITNDMIAGAPCLSIAVTDFKAFAKDSILVGHNVDFDLRMLARAAIPNGINFDNEYFDTNKLARTLMGKQGWSKTSLGYLCDELSIPLDRAHRADADAEATAQVYLAMKKIIDA